MLSRFVVVTLCCHASLCSHGWQLGEHGEFAKHTNFDLATRTPLIIRVPGVTDTAGYRGRQINGFAEFVDIFPTLAELAGVPVPQTCPPDAACMDGGVFGGVPGGCPSASTEIRLCTDGASLAPALDCYAGGAIPGSCDARQLKAAAFSVYPHYGVNEWHNVLGYSMTTVLGGIEWRYSEWVPFDSSQDWTMAGYNPGRYDMVEQDSSWCTHRGRCLAARELYNHATGAHRSSLRLVPAPPPPHAPPPPPLNPPAFSAPPCHAHS
eukprot:SAG22_NODE_3050_length_1983_cov_1.332272_2_plen_264_part_01